ncbi:cell adhesion molecule Dscam2-like isoform X2 [Panulirus ornatus]|uniref:cell adhesion molecule Dscam2-like isoform X2 n=1 Tax=Panulirus ornatus TaxID=150431 RepID=UPI003A84EB9E
MVSVAVRMIASVRLLGLLVLGVEEALGGGSGPVLVLEPPARTYLTNSTGVTLRCAALGTPTPSITWVAASGEPVQSQPGLREVLPNGSLWLAPASPGGAHVSRSTYRCKATNPTGTVLSRATTLTTVMLAEVSVRAEGSRVAVGGVGVVKCHVGGTVVGGWTVATWLVQDTPSAAPVPLPDAGRYVYGSERTLYIQDVTQADSHASFMCRVLHRAARTPVTSPPTALTVLAAPSTDSPPRMDPDLTRMLEVVEGQPFTIPCLAHSHPPPHYSWSREGVGGELSTVGGGVGVAVGRMWVRGAVVGGARAGPADAGGYTCVAANGAGTDTAHFTLTVVQELQITAHPPLQMVSAGSRVTIACRVQGSPVAEVRWYRDGSPLHPHTHAHILLQGRDTLAIAGVGERDAGMYQCVAANSVGEAQATTQLSIRDSPPVLRETFIEQTLQPGPPVSLKCTAMGHPSPVVTWSLDGRPLTPSAAHYGGQRVGVGSWVGVGGQVVSQVNISSVDHLHGGLYTCTAVNAAGHVQHAARLNVYGPPTTRKPANVSVVDGSEASLVCPVAGYPLATVSWTLHGRPLTPTARRTPRGDGTLAIQRVEAEYDVGHYSCIASDARGRTATATFFLSVVKPPVLAELKFPTGLVEGMRLSVACSLLSGDLPISLRWSRNGRPLPRDPVLTETHSQFFSNLVFADIRGRHAGEYTCTASNSAASSTVTATMHVRVPPLWVVEPQDVAVVGGEEVALECHAQGTPTPTVIWKRTRDGAGVEESAAVVGDGWRIRTPRPGSLRIRDARAEDSGRYLCLAQNGVNPPITKTISLSVLEGARMEERVLNQSAAVGDSLTLRCPARGDLPLAITWTRDGIAIPASSSPELEVRLEEGGRTSVLVISSTTRAHAAVYTCQASNRYGSDSMTFFLNVVERPDPPGHVHVREVTSRHVSLAWAPPFDGNSPLTHYLLQHWPAHDASATPTNTTLPRDLTQATVKGLSPGRVYHVQVLAVNARGASPPSPTLSITTLQEPPTAPPTRLRAHARQQATVTLSWQPPAAHLSPGEVTGYQVGYHEADVGEDGDQRWRSVRGGALTAEITGLKHYTAYSVTVRAINQVGAGPPAQPVTVTTSQGVPSAPPESVKCDPLSSQALRVRWHPLPLNLSNGPVQGYKVFYKRTSNIEGSNAVEIKRTTNLETNLQGLGRFTNYSVRILAFTAAGDGVVSSPVHCSTLQDVPGAPVAIRALPSSRDAVMVSWLMPTYPNGILTHYTLYYRPLNAHQATRSMVVAGEAGAVPWVELSREVGGLDSHARYEFWVTASTRVGEGTASRVVSESPSAAVPARIRSFGQSVEVQAGGSLTLPCAVVGTPAPAVTWTHLGRDNIPQAQTLPDHSLHASVVGPDIAGNYTCHAHNPKGRDESTWVVRVVQTPPPPTLRIQYATETAIHLSWDSTGDGGKPITGYVIRYRLEGQQAWVEETVEPGETSASLQQLRCGSTYHVQVLAISLVGRGQPSHTVNTRTRGSAPRQPRHQDLVSVNSSSVTLHLYTWPSGGCPITWWAVEYRPHSDATFTPVASHLAGDTDSVTLPELAPLTWYQLRITAHNAAGSATATYDVATASLTGATLAPESVVEVVEATGSPLYLDPHVLAPVVSGVACTLALLLCVGLLISRGRARFMKGDAAAAAGEGQRGGSGAPTYGRSLAELQNHRNDSQEQLSPAARAKHEEAYTVEEPYEICPYATFSLPPGNAGGGDALDYTLQFQTFGHQDCYEGQPQPSRSSSFMGGKRRENAAAAAVGGGVGGTGPSAEIACISSQQTLPISSVGGRGRICRRNQAGEEGHGSDSEQDTSGSPGATPAHGVRDTYKVPVRLRRGADFTLHPPDSSTESNDERSPVPPRRPPHLQQQQQQQQQQPTNPPPTHQQHAHPQHARRQHAFTPAHAHVLRSNTLESVYSVEGAVGGGPLRPPTGFSDSRELSEAECDRDPRETSLGGQKGRGQQPRRSFTPRTANDYSIHV